MKALRTPILILVLLQIFLNAQLSLAAVYPSYTYNFWGEPVPAPQAYLPLTIIDGTTLGIGAFNSPQDIFVTKDQDIYVVDSGNNRIVVLDSQFQLQRIIDSFDNGDQTDRFRNPSGVFVTDQDDIFVADQDNGRIVVISQELELQKTISRSPLNEDDDVFPENFRPQKVIADRAQRIYALAYGVFDGILVFSSEGKFRGYIGAPRVAPDLYEYFWYRLATDAQRQRLSLYLPVEHSNIAIDEEGCIYATVTAGALAETDKVRRLNPAGKDVLRRMGFVPPIGDVISSPSNDQPASVFVDVVPRENGIYSVLDRVRSRIFTYDANGNLLYVFGGRGDRFGQFDNPVALDVLGDLILVLDRAANRLLVFEPTEYALMIHAAIDLYNQGKYEDSAGVWEKVLQANSNFDLAYTGIGDSLLGRSQYEFAMEVYHLGNNRDGYSKAFAEHRRQVVAENFGLIVGGTMLVIILIGLLGKMASKKGSSDPASAQLAYYQQMAEMEKRSKIARFGFQLVTGLKYAIHLIFHPFDGFWDLKYEKRGNVYSASCLLLLVTFSYIFMRQYSGFIVNTNNLAQLNIFVELASVLIPFGLWCVVNWALTTLAEGKGSLIDVFIASAYALTPIILINIPITIVSNFLTKGEMSFYYLFVSIAVGWAILLLFIGTMVTHEYDVVKTMLISVMVIAGMIFVMFLGLLFFSLVDQVGVFFRDIYKELTFRI